MLKILQEILEVNCYLFLDVIIALSKNWVKEGNTKFQRLKKK